MRNCYWTSIGRHQNRREMSSWGRNNLSHFHHLSDESGGYWNCFFVSCNIFFHYHPTGDILTTMNHDNNNALISCHGYQVDRMVVKHKFVLFADLFVRRHHCQLLGIARSWPCLMYLVLSGCCRKYNHPEWVDSGNLVTMVEIAEIQWPHSSEGTVLVWTDVLCVRSYYNLGNLKWVVNW